MTEISQSVFAAFSNADGKPGLDPRTSIVSDTVSSGVTFASILIPADVEASIKNDGSQILVEDGESSHPLSAAEGEIDTETSEDKVPSEPDEQIILLMQDRSKNHRQINFAAESDPKIEHHTRMLDSEMLVLGTNTPLVSHSFQSDEATDESKKTNSTPLLATGPLASAKEPIVRHEIRLTGKTQNSTSGSTIVHETTVSTASFKGSPEAFGGGERSGQDGFSQAMTAKHTKLSIANVEEPPVQGSLEKLKDASIAGIASLQHYDRGPATANSYLHALPQEDLRLGGHITYQARRNHPDMLAERAVHTAAESTDQKLSGQSFRPQIVFDTIGGVEQKPNPEHVLQFETTPRLNSSSTLIQAQSASVPNQPEARFIAHQLGIHLSNKKERTTTIRLSPEELGQVRMTLRTSETGLTLAISAERPETSEMMRRNIDVLAQEFQSLGFENLNFQFGDEASDKNTEPPIDHTSIGEGDTPQQLGPAPQHKAGQNGRLDMRI